MHVVKYCLDRDEGTQYGHWSLFETNMPRSQIVNIWRAWVLLVDRCSTFINWEQRSHWCARHHDSFHRHTRLLPTPFFGNCRNFCSGPNVLSFLQPLIQMWYDRRGAKIHLSASSVLGDRNLATDLVYPDIIKLNLRTHSPDKTASNEHSPSQAVHHIIWRVQK